MGRLRGTIEVRRQVKLSSGNSAYLALLNGRKVRTVPLPSSVRDELAAYLARYPARTVTVPWDRPDGAPVTVRLAVHRPRVQAALLQRARLEGRPPGGWHPDDARERVSRPAALLREPAPRRRRVDQDRQRTTGSCGPGVHAPHVHAPHAGQREPHAGHHRCRIPSACRRLVCPRCAPGAGMTGVSPAQRQESRSTTTSDRPARLAS